MRKSSAICVAVAAVMVAHGDVGRAATFYNSDGFEAVAGFVPGALKGQTEPGQPSWKVRTTAPNALAASTATVETSNVFSGTQAVQFTRAVGDLDTYFAPVTSPVQTGAPLTSQFLDVSWNMEAPSGATQDPFFGIVAFNGSARLGYAGIDATTGQVQYSQGGSAALLTSATTVALNQWNSFDFQLDYVNQTETIFVNGQAAATTSFIAPGQTSFTDGDIASFASNALQSGAGTVYFDNYLVSTSNASYSAGANLTWNNTGGSGDGSSWDIGVSQNFNNGSGAVTFNNGDNVLFNDVNNGHYAVNVNSVVSPGSVTVNSSGNYTFTGPGGISGTGGFSKSGEGTLTLSTVNTYTGDTTVNAGTLVLVGTRAFPANTNLIIASGAEVVVSRPASGPATVVDIHSLTNNGILDLRDNALIVESTSQFGSIVNQVAEAFNGGAWNGASGITSTVAANNPSRLTALGVIANDNGSGTPLYGSGGLLGLFDGAAPTDGDVLVKYTYYGDANLDGVVDGSDYSRIDNGYLTKATGWYNGDFNYDGVINGSDYTLIDNAFNMQGASLAGLIAAPSASSTAETVAVPEPAMASLISVVSFGLLRSRQRRLINSNKSSR